MDQFRLPSSVDFHLPSSMVGASFIRSKEKSIFDSIKADIANYYTGPIDLIKLMAIVDSVDQTAGLGFTESMKILGNVMSYLRIKLLSRDLRITEMTAVLLDVLVKNCQYRIHIYVGRRIFMKTFCLVLRQLLVDEREQHRSAGVRMLDILQGWGEAFKKHRRDIYPFVVASYEKTRYKYGIRYPRADYDPTRVPIFLGPVNEHELREAADTRAQLGLFEKDLHEELGDQVDDGDAYSVDSQSQSPSRCELERVDSDMIMFEEEKEPIDAISFTPTKAVNMSHSSSSIIPAKSETAADSTNDTKQKPPYFEMDTDMISFEDRDPITNSPYRKTTTPTDGSPSKGDTATLSSKNLIEFDDVKSYPVNSLCSDSDGFRPSGTAAVPLPVPIAVSVVTDHIESGTDTDIGNNTSSQALPLHPQSSPLMTFNNSTVPPPLPVRSSTATPYYGVTRGIVPLKDTGSSDRLDVLNKDIQHILSSMKGDSTSTRPPVKPVRAPPKKPEKGPPMMKPEKALLLAAEKVLQIRSEKNSPVKATESSPIRVRKTSPMREEKTSPIKVRKTSPMRDENTSPTRMQKVSPTRDENTSPIRVQKVSPIRAETTPERKVMILVISAHPSRNQSPVRTSGTKTHIPESPIVEPTSQIISEKGSKEEKEVEVVEVKVEVEKVKVEEKEIEIEIEAVVEKEIEVKEKEVKVEEKEVVLAEVKSCLSDDIPLPPVLPPLPPSQSRSLSPSSSSYTSSCSETLPSDPSNRGTLEPNSEKENNRETKSLNNITPFGTKTLRSDSCDSAGSDHYDRYDVTDKAKPSRRGTGYAPPSSDPSVEVRYFGHQRVVIKKK